MDNLFLILFLFSFVALIVGLIKPTVFSRIIKGEITRKKIATIFSIATIASFILFGVTTDSSENAQVMQEPVTNSEVVVENVNQNPAPVDAVKDQVSAEVKNKSVPVVTVVPAQQTSTETVSQKNAIKKAKSYLSYSSFSHDGLVAQLEYEQFSHTDAVYGADNSGANWNEQAAKKAKSYMEYSAFSRGSLINQLKYEKFTQEQAEYGANAVGL